LDRCDLFATSVKQFNFEGRTKVHSSLGVCCSTICTVLMTCIALSGLARVLVGSSPNVYTVKYFDSYSTKDNALSWKKNNFQIAFGMRGYIDHEIKHNSAQVLW